jgi:chromosome segregation ATPase
MWQPFEVFVNDGFFKEALPQAAFWGRIALGVGCIGFFTSVLLVLMHLRDRLSLRRAEQAPKDYRPPQWGPLSRSLGQFFADPVSNAPLSPDAAAEYVVGRLEASRDAASSAIRFFSYAPLLFGLMGTIFALRSLLVLQGNTLQQIQPQLAGVFAGTLAGIVGALVATAGSVMLDSASLSAVNRAQDFIHRHILPTLPERRIAVRIEDAILSLIGEKAQAVAQSFGKTLQPVATQMEQISERCSKAAEVAMKSLTEAARAVREAGNLETASYDFKKGAHMIDSAAEQLSDATKQTAEVILRVGEIRQSLNELLSRLAETSQSLAQANKAATLELTSRITELNSQGERLGTTASTLGPAIEGLSTELIRRASSDFAHLETIKGHIESTSRNFSHVTVILNESANHLKVMPSRLEQIAGVAADGTRQGVAAAMGQVAAEIARKLEDVVASLELIARAFSKAIAGSAAEGGESGTDSVDLARGIREATSEMRMVSQEVRKLTALLQKKQMMQGEGAPKKANGFFRRWLDR